MLQALARANRRLMSWTANRSRVINYVGGRVRFGVSFVLPVIVECIIKSRTGGF